MQQFEIAAQVSAALAEDIGSGDLTAQLIPADAQAHARLIVREYGVICGCAWVDEVFAQIDDSVQIDWQVKDGDRVARDSLLCEFRGPARSILTGERSALNFLQTLSGTATTVATYVDTVEGTDVKLLDTRKTVPGLRLAQKYAVTCGGGYNHRIGLFDAFLVKENHIIAAGGIAEAVRDARAIAADVLLEVEVESLDELQQAIDAGVDRVLLDNFTLQMLRDAVELNAGRIGLEASGGVNLDTIRGIAETGVDFISVGGLTKDVRALDLSMRFVD